jgi:hypothetical protein
LTAYVFESSTQFRDRGGAAVSLFSKLDMNQLKAIDRKSTAVRIVVLFDSAVTMDAKELEGAFERLWMNALVCDSILPQPGQRDDVQRFSLNSEGIESTLTVVGMPLPADLTRVMEQMTSRSALPFRLDDSQLLALKNHKAHAIVEATVFEVRNNPQKEVDKAWFLMRTVIALQEQIQGFAGYISVAAQVYHPGGWLRGLLKDREVQKSDLFVLLGNLHFVVNGDNWVHTHGMEQFGLPDIEARFSDRDQASYFTNLVGDAAMYTVDSEAMALGNTLELMGDGVIYKVVEAKPEPDHDYGAFGAIAIVKE